MSTSPRSSLLALFFVLGMLFMAALFVMGRPDLWLQQVQSTAAKGNAEGQGDQSTRRNPKEKPLSENIITSSLQPSSQNTAAPAEVPALSDAEKADIAKPPSQLEEGNRSGATEAPQNSNAHVQQQSKREYTSSVTYMFRSGRADQITGRIFLAGEPPEERPVPLDLSCGRLEQAPRTTRIFVTDNEGGLADVVVSVHGQPEQEWPAPQEPLSIRNENCNFEPYVSAVRAGQPIVIHNLDPVMHNAHIVPSNSLNLERNYAQMPKAKPLTISFDAPEEFLRMKCDVHPWMFAYVSIFAHPFFAVTDRNGRFSIHGLPPGSYTVKATHRKAGTRTLPVELREGFSASMKFRFEVPTEVTGK